MLSAIFPILPAWAEASGLAAIVGVPALLAQGALGVPWQGIVSQAPGLVVLAWVAQRFLSHMERRDAEFKPVIQENTAAMREVRETMSRCRAAQEAIKEQI